MRKLIYVIIVICFLDLFVQFPIVTPYALELGASEFMASIVVATYSVTNLLGNVIGGYASDRFGRKRTLVLGMFLQVLIISTYVTSPSIALLLGIRIVHGFTSGMITPAAFSLVQDVSRREAIGKAMALTGVSIGLAAVFGPATSGIISSIYGYSNTYLVLAIVYVIGLLLTLVAVKESTTTQSRKEYKETSWKTLITRRPLVIAYIASLSLMTSMGALSFALPIKTMSLNLDDRVTGMLLSVFGITAIIVFGTPLNNMFNKVTANILIKIGLVVISLAMLTIHFAENLSILYIALGVYGVGYAFVFPSMNKLIGQFTSLNERGKANGIFYAFFSIGSVVGSTLAGYFTKLFTIPFFGMTVVLLILLIVFSILDKGIDFTEV
ncbi:MAG TPA: MFS transporter [Candidatus Nosocomiicoccus stercorigallinarum]|nr:MFS transporter [Candidatus Nosocomiicoccus stercorigallinarum]